MNLDDLLKEMKGKMQSRDLSDKYLEENGKMTRTEMGIGEYSYGITTIPCEWVYNFLSDYKKVLKENEQLRTEVNSLKEEKEQYKNDYFNLYEQNKQYIHYSKIEGLAEKIHNKLDKNGITRAYQTIIDSYFDEVLGG